jgi:threonine dehydrogenase-like Zn-dependent dehydrogenase
MGPVGLMAVAGTRLLGAGLVIAVDCVPSRLELARQYGADVVINFKEQDPIAEIMRLTGGHGADAAMDALGSQATFENCVKATRAGGVISNIGYFGHGDTVNIPAPSGAWAWARRPSPPCCARAAASAWAA